MARGLDHIVHAVRDLDAAAELYRRLDFQVGSRNRHPPEWGTQNHIVQLDGTFIELLTVTDRAHIAPHAESFFSFGAFNRDFLDRGEGLAMLVLEGRGAADADEFQAAGIGGFKLYEFEREAKRPDGAPLKVAFSLAFAADPLAPDAGFFTCRHRYPEHFWNPAFQVHANTSAAVAGVVLVADNPGDHQVFLSAFSGERNLLITPSGIAIETPRGGIEILRPQAFRDRFGTAPPGTDNGARLAALRFAVRDFDVAAAMIGAAIPTVSERTGRLIIGPAAAMGATLTFERI